MKTKSLTSIVILLILCFSTFAQDTNRIVPLDVDLARKIAKDLERYDLCKIQRESLTYRVSLLDRKISLKDSIIFEKEKILRDFKSIRVNNEETIKLQEKRINRLDEARKKRKLERNIAIIGGVIASLTIIIAK